MKIWLPTIRAGSGADVFTERLAAGLQRAGCEPVVTWFAHQNELWPGMMKHVPPQGTAVIHANTWSAFAFAGHGLPTVATEHGFVSDPDFMRAKAWVQRIYHALLIRRYVFRSFRRCTAIAAVSRHVADRIQPYCPGSVAVIPNWVDTDLFQPAKKAGADPAFRVLYAGTRASHKGFDIVHALAKQQMPGVELWCPEDLKQYLEPHRARMVFYGRLEHKQMPGLYAQSDVVLVPSRYEGFGYVAAEAMACGRPVIGFDCSALREVCGTEGAAVLVRMGDAAAIGNAINDLAADRGQCAEMGEAGRQRALERFTEAKAIGAYVSMYQSLLG